MPSPELSWSCVTAQSKRTTDVEAGRHRARLLCARDRHLTARGCLASETALPGQELSTSRATYFYIGWQELSMSRATYLYMHSQLAPQRPVPRRVRAPRLPPAPGLDDGTLEKRGEAAGCITLRNSIVQVSTYVRNAVKWLDAGVVVTCEVVAPAPTVCTAWTV